MNPRIDYKKTLELIFMSMKLEPVKEYKFHPTRRWRIDFAFPERKIAVEYEGMAFMRGSKSRHTTITGFSNDAEKYNELALAGWLLLRFNATHVNKGIALQHITRAFQSRPA